MEIYELLRECDDLETLLTRFGGDDENKRQDAENFLMLLTKSGCLSGYLPADSPELPPLPKMTNPIENLGYGNSMLGTFETGDRMEMCQYPYEKFQRGDVINFIDRRGNKIGHRIVRGKAGKSITMGDNNDSVDRYPVTAAQKPQLITGKFHHGKYYPIARGKAGMRHFYFFRFKRSIRNMVKTALRMPILLLVKCCFWRKRPDRQTDFGSLIQYSYRGRLIGWKINGRNVYVRNILRFTFQLP
jgi:hypothetical protein